MYELSLTLLIPVMAFGGKFNSMKEVGFLLWVHPAKTATILTIMSRNSQGEQGDEESQHEQIDDRFIEPIKKGYRDVAHLMAYENSPFAIFRRFGQLNMLNLLCLQAELMQLQKDLRAVCDADDLDSTRSRFAYSFYDMKVKYDASIDSQSRLQARARSMKGHVHQPAESYEVDARDFESQTPLPAETPENRENRRQYELLLRLRLKLKEYSESPFETRSMMQYAK